ncbi:sigma-54 interaction domain-containing protein [Acidaminobacter hydrogenoformans]|uniref:Arginine utilization regulatory protein n=1 Tax=Acidaminobacter hydrogenoformans DSM 2784 TaxID=1120920 RepID=A0A1G5RTX7_9FIRM|nr:sigma 54-interacting transcriptional regulator [Acidaminobacter hydrogenoformans]SCZ77308.1 arginine utilization regulatory protein [Acidaminobacter hydrogenoformans DSM 2784]
MAVYAKADPEMLLFALQKIIESISDGVVMSDAQGRLIIYNQAQERLEELRGTEIIGKPLWEAYGYDPENESEHRQVLTSGKAVENRYEAHAINNGIPKYVSYSTYPIIKNGEAVGVFSISKNETKLHSLLEEAIELKRRFLSLDPEMQEPVEDPGNGTRYSFSNIIGDSEATRQLIKEAQKIAWLDNNILIVGETGTGKEVYAQSIHNHGKKHKEPFIGINCAAIPENLLEGILFGTVKGAYTGALDRSGLFEDARGGTLFLDELNSMPVSMQTKLLRVLQERKVNRVGGSEFVPVKCRVVCAMNEDPLKLIGEGKLRQDLYYRIGGLSLYILPLRQRPEDIRCLTRFFIQKYNHMLNTHVEQLSETLERAFENYGWPGNIRELEHVIENLMVHNDDQTRVLEGTHLPAYLKASLNLGTDSERPKPQRKEPLNDRVDSFEREIILDALCRNSYNISSTSRELGIIRQSLLYKMKRLGIEKPTS